MELEAELTEERKDGAVTTARAQCADGHVRLTIDDPVTGKTSTRTLALDDQHRGLRSRMLGLAIAEAVLASWVELQLTPEPAVPRPDAVALPETRREAAAIAERRMQGTTPPSPPWEVIAGPMVRWFSSSVLTFGLSASARHWFDEHPLAGLGLELDGSFGEHSVRDVARATATSFSFAPCLLIRSDLGPPMLITGAGWRIAPARLSAEPEGLRPGDSAWSLWTGPFLSAALDVRLSRSLFFHASMEIGYVLAPAQGRVSDEPVIELGGSWLGALLSLGTQL